jgi:hypothetical protein
MAAKRAAVERRKPNPHIPCSVCRARDPFFGGVETRVVCADNQPHEYLNAGVPEETLPLPAYGACPVCGKSTSPLIGTLGVKCAECRLDDYWAQIAAFEQREGITIMPRHEDPATIRERWGFFDFPIRVCFINWGNSVYELPVHSSTTG